MAGEVAPEGPNLKEMGEEELWELINDNRHRISLGVRPCILLPYLRQVKVLSEVDEDEILSCHNLTNRCMRTSYMLDLLRTQGRNGAIALLEGLMIHYPALYTQVTGRKPSTEPSRFSGLIKYSELTEYLIRAVTGMQTELQEARNEAGRMSARCSSLESEVGQLIEQEEKSRHLQTENERLQRHLSSLQREVTKLKDEKCDLYIRYTAAIEEKLAINGRLHNLNLQVSCYDAQAMIARILAEKDALRIQLVELQEAVFTLQAKRSPRIQRQRSHVWFSTHKLPHTVHTSTREYRSNFIYVFGLALKLKEISWESPTSSSEECKHRKSIPVFSFLLSLSKTSAPPFLVRSRPKAIRVNGRVLSISLQCDALLSELTVVGGNKSGVFVHQVTEGSTAHSVGISPGAQIVEVRYEQNNRALKMVLEDSTLEEATWALSQVTGFCHLSLRPRQKDYEALLQQLQNTNTASGDSFYIRVNLSLSAGASGTLAVSCNDILHVTNTRPAGAEDQWHVSQVHPCQLLDLQSGAVPNYYRSVLCLDTPSEQKAVRIVSTGRQGRNPLWLIVARHFCLCPFSSEGPPSPSKSCVTLMPYTLVTPHFPPVCRPVLLLPTILGRMLDSKLANWQGFQLCVPEVLTSSEHAARLQRSEILEEVEPGGNQCFTLQGVEKVMKKGLHCVLPLGLDCVRRLHRSEIFPIIIFIGLSARNARKLRSKLQRNNQTEEQLLACAKSEEPLLDKLPCLYHSMAPGSWCDQTSLLTSLRTVIWEEQRKIVWYESPINFGI
uniref:Caspase recruitment domain family, member 14 n=1 Tax=Fundulus heteroclitus TaxID=8078 RepID=A0A3Q2Q8Q0_FUNHE